MIVRVSAYESFFDRAAQTLIKHVDPLSAEWRPFLVLVPSARMAQSLKLAINKYIKHPSFLPRILTFDAMPEFILGAHPHTTWSTEQRTAYIYEHLKESSPIKRLKLAQSLEKQADELNQHGHTIFNEHTFDQRFRSIFEELTPVLYKVYHHSKRHYLRIKTETIIKQWNIHQPEFSVAIVGSTASSYISRSWHNWAIEHNHLVIERDIQPDQSPPDSVVFTSFTNANSAMEYAARWINRSPDSSSIISATHHVDLLQYFAAHGTPVHFGGELPFKLTPLGQWWNKLIMLISNPTLHEPLLFEWLHQTSPDHETLTEAELCARKTSHNPYASFFQNRSHKRTLNEWWSFILNLISQLPFLPHVWLASIISKLPCSIELYGHLIIEPDLLPHIDSWWPISHNQPTLRYKSSTQLVGPMESRGLNAEHLLIYNFSDNAWVASQPIEPWLSTHDRLDLGLPDTEHFQRLAYHDWIATWGGRQQVEVMLFDQDSPCRFAPIDRIQHNQASTYQAIQPIQPSIGVHRNPITHISITGADLLMRDSYAYYIRHILKIKQLDNLPHNFEHKHTRLDQGILFHKALEHYQNPEIWKQFFDAHHLIDHFWLKQLQKCLKQFSLGSGEHIEKSYQLHTQGIELNGRIDRIDTTPNLHIINFKTGTLSSLADIKNGRAPQLALETLLVAKNENAQSGSSSLISLKHTSSERLFKWKAEDIERIEQNFSTWIQSIASYQALGLKGFEHIERFI